MAIKYKFIDEAKLKVKKILSYINIPENKDFVANEMLTLIGGGAINEMLERLAEDKRKELVQGFKDKKFPEYLEKLRALFTETQIEEIYKNNFIKYSSEMTQRFKNYITDIEAVNKLIS